MKFKKIREQSFNTVQPKFLSVLLETKSSDYLLWITNDGVRDVAEIPFNKIFADRKISQPFKSCGISMKCGIPQNFE